MSSTQKRRTRSPHPGIVLLRPDPAGRHPNWRARYADPDSGRVVKTTLDPTGLPTAESRRDWAIKKARSIAKRRMDLESGAHRATGTTLEDALRRYWEDHPKLRERTLEIYRRSAAKLQAWAKHSAIRSADDVRGPQLVAFRAELTREPRRVHALGGKRGQQRKTKEPRSASTINIELRAIRTILGYLRKLGLLPDIDTDDLKDGLERLAVSHERGNFLKPHELQKLLDAALRHDTETFAATREEHAGEREPGTTLRYEPIAPIVACALLTGMRFGEVTTLEWKQVDLDALGSDGEVVGEINLTAATKTKRARTVGLEVSPALRKLLAAMHLKAGTKRMVFRVDARHGGSCRQADPTGIWGSRGVYLANASADLWLLPHERAGHFRRRERVSQRQATRAQRQRC